MRSWGGIRAVDRGQTRAEATKGWGMVGLMEVGVHKGEAAVAPELRPRERASPGRRMRCVCVYVVLCSGVQCDV